MMYRKIAGYTILGIGFIVMTMVPLHIGNFQNLTLLVASLLASPLILGQDKFKKLFQAPKGKWILWALAMVVVHFSFGAIGGKILSLIGADPSSNAVMAELSWSFLLWVPFMMMGEELFSITILEDLNSVLDLKWASLLTALIFGLIHFMSYYQGNVVGTLAQIIILIGFARIWLNIAYVKGGRSIWSSWVAHMIIDNSIFILGLLMSAR